MSHDPIHDWLDMAFRKAGGSKNAYSEYKNDQRWKRNQRGEERARRQGGSPEAEDPPLYLRDPGGRSYSGTTGTPLNPRTTSPPLYLRNTGTPLNSQGTIPQFNVSSSGGGLPGRSSHYGQSYGSSSGPSRGPFMSRGLHPSGLPSRHYTTGGLHSYERSRDPYMSGSQSPYEYTGSLVSGSLSQSGRPESSIPEYSISSASSGRGSPRSSDPAQDQRLIGWSQSPASSSVQQLNAPLPGLNAQPHQRRGGSGSPQGSLSRALVPYRERAVSTASGSRSRSASDATHRTGIVPTAQSPLGDMTRSYLEGMVANSQADSFRRRHR